MTEPTLFDQMDEVIAKFPNFGRFHNTVNLQGDELKKREKKIGGQNLEVLQLFKRFPNESFTANEVLDKLYMDNPMSYFRTPITSIRRALTDLSKLNYIVKTNEKRPGKYDLNTYTWRLK